LLDTSEKGQPQLEFSRALPPDGVMFPYARRSAVAGYFRERSASA